MYYVTGPDQKEVGPIDIETLRTWVREGRLPPEAPVRGLAEAAPVPAAKVGALADLYKAPPSSSDPFASFIPSKNPSALWGYYLGFGSLIPILGALAVPFCIWQSMAGLKAFGQDPTVRGRTHSIVGLLLGIVGLVIQVFVISLVIVMVTAGRRAADPY